jgi:membrane-associated protein
MHTRIIYYVTQSCYNPCMNISNSYIYVENFFATSDAYIVYLFVTLVMIINGAINFPSSQIFYLFLGYISLNSPFNIFLLVLSGATGNTVGNYIVYSYVSRYGVNMKSMFAKIFSLDSSIVDNHFKRLEQKNLAYLVVGKLIPSVKVFVPIYAGMIKVERKKVIAIFFVSSIIWAFALINFGLVFGKNVSLQKYFIVATTIYVVVFIFVKNTKRNL